MKTFGGSFVRALADLVIQADEKNLPRIKAAWPEYWSKYEGLGKRLEAEDLETLP
jgi:hypothetical protein